LFYFEVTTRLSCFMNKVVRHIVDMLLKFTSHTRMKRNRTIKLW